jgi:hypothetical protein
VLSGAERLAGVERYDEVVCLRLETAPRRDDDVMISKAFGM